MTTPQKVLLGCGVTFVVGVLAIGGCGMFVYRSFQGFPEYAKREAVYSAHKDVIDQVNAIIVASDSLPKVQQGLGAATWPEKVIYIKIREDESTAKLKDVNKKVGPVTVNRGSGTREYVDAFKRYSWSSISNFSMNGSGHGTMRTDRGQVKFVIVDNSQLNARGEQIKYTIYIEHTAPPSPGSARP
jgi:hypothetical protein